MIEPPAARKSSFRIRPFRNVASALMLAAACLTGFGCFNRPRADDDIAICVRLSRKYVRKNMYEAPTETITWDCLKDAHGDGVILVFLLVPVIAGIQYAAQRAGGTKGYIWPKGYEKSYMQRLYWGKTRVYLPRCVDGQIVPVLIRFEGNYEGTREIEIDLTADKKVKL